VPDYSAPVPHEVPSRAHRVPSRGRLFFFSGFSPSRLRFSTGSSLFACCFFRSMLIFLWLAVAALHPVFFVRLSPRVVSGSAGTPFDHCFEQPCQEPVCGVALSTYLVFFDCKYVLTRYSFSLREFFDGAGTRLGRSIFRLPLSCSSLFQSPPQLCCFLLQYCPKTLDTSFLVPCAHLPPKEGLGFGFQSSCSRLPSMKSF